MKNRTELHWVFNHRKTPDKEEIKLTNPEKSDIMTSGNNPCDSCFKNGKPNCGNKWCFTNKEEKDGYI